MKIAYVYDAVYPWVKGGAERRIYELSKMLAARGHDVHCYGMKWWKGEDVISSEGVNLHGICKPVGLYSGPRRSPREALYFASRVLMSLKGDCDLVDCQEFPYFPCFSAKALSALRGFELFITWHEVWGDYWLEYLGRKGILGKGVERAAAKLTAKNIAVSERTRRDLEALGGRNAVVVPNGIDFKGISRVRPSGEASDVVYFGRLAEHKNVDLLLRALCLAAREVPDLKAVVIGDGPEAERLRYLARELGLKGVKFTGFLDYDEAIALMKASKVNVLPSTREGFGMAALEANACGLPVVTLSHKMNAACDLLREGTGVACELSEKSIAEGIMRCLSGSGVSAERCLSLAEGYDWDRIAGIAEKVYEGGSP